MQWDSFEFEDRLVKDMNASEYIELGKVTRLNWAIVMALAAHFAATIWWASQITARLDAVVVRVQEVVSTDISRLERRIEKLEDRGRNG